MTHRVTSERTRSHVGLLLMMAIGMALVALALWANLPAPAQSPQEFQSDPPLELGAKTQGDAFSGMSAYSASSANTSAPREEAHPLQPIATERSSDRSKVAVHFKDVGAESTSAPVGGAASKLDGTKPFRLIPRGSVQALSRSRETTAAATPSVTTIEEDHPTASSPLRPGGDTRIPGRRYFFLPAPLDQGINSGQAAHDDTGLATSAVNDIQPEAEHRSGLPLEVTPERIEAENEPEHPETDADLDSSNIPKSIEEVPEDAGNQTKNLLRVYAWVQTPPSELFSWSPPISMQHSAARTADMYAAAWAGVPDTLRVIQFAPWAKFQTTPFREPLRQLILEGPDLSTMERWWREFLWALDQRGLRPHRAALDLEAGFGYWQVPGPRVETFRKLFNDPKIAAVLPESILKISPEGFDYRDARNRQNIKAWQDYAGERRAATFRAAFQVPLEEQFPGAKITNYWDGIRGEPLAVDLNGWPYPRESISEEASPTMYHTSVELNRLEIESAASGTDVPVVPWIPPPSYIGRDVWTASVEAAVDLGVREFLFWNAGVEEKLEDDDAFAIAVFERLNRELQNMDRSSTSFD